MEDSANLILFTNAIKGLMRGHAHRSNSIGALVAHCIHSAFIESIESLDPTVNQTWTVGTLLLSPRVCDFKLPRRFTLRSKKRERRSAVS